jgi:hypothetical protein
MMAASLAGVWAILFFFVIKVGDLEDRVKKLEQEREEESPAQDGGNSSQ